MVKGHCESEHYLESNLSVEIFSAEIFSAEIFSAEIFSAEPSLHCGTLTAEASPARKLPFSASIPSLIRIAWDQSPFRLVKFSD